MPTVRKRVTIQANVEWVSFQSSTSKRYIGVCDMLNLSLEADSEDELRSLIPEAMDLLMGDLLSDNELDGFLKEKGWQAINLPARPDGDIKFEVPFELIAAGARRDSERRPH